MGKWWDGKALIFAGFLLAGNFKADPRLSWLPVDLTLLFALLTAACTAAAFVKNNCRIPRQLFWMLALYLLFALPLFGLDGSDDAGEKVLKLFTFTLLASVAPFFLFKEKAEIRTLFHMLTAFGLMLGLDAILSSFADGELRITSEHATGMTAFGANTIGLGRAVGTALLWIAILGLEGRLGPIKTLGFLCFSLVVLIGSGSRGPILAAAAGLGLLALLFYWKRGTLLLRFAGVLLVLAAVGAYSVTVAPATATERVQQLLQGKIDNSEAMRLQAYQLSWDVIKETPAGIGWGGFTSRINLWFGASRQYPHNLILEILLEGGWLQGFFLCGLVLYAFIRMYRQGILRSSYEARTLFVLLFFFFANAMVSGDINDNKILFATLALTLGYGGENA
ncbi:O-antigen ligase family protein [Brevibacillus sp. B_LB10_24]|uniref:O-antigen ligase family protein n=1 Tax=Brevibacillus sp. B_LB10_24 TaxID=3380645 RepID=UPI0038BADB6E